MVEIWLYLCLLLQGSNLLGDISYLINDKGSKMPSKGEKKAFNQIEDRPHCGVNWAICLGII